MLKADRDKVSSGEVIAENETDKATMEVEAADEGVLGKIIVPAGTKAVAVNSLIGVLLEEGEDRKALEQVIDGNASVKIQAVAVEEKKASASAEVAPKMEVTQESNSRVFASPLAKRLAQEKHLDLAKISGSGPRGRIIKSDVVNSSAAPRGVSRVKPESTQVPISTMREVIAQRLCESKQQIPHFYLSIDCNIDRLLQVRHEINLSLAKDNPTDKISVNDMVTKAVSLALRDVQEVNVSWSGNAITQYHNVDVSIAVAIKDGLITPIVKNADGKTVFEISKEIKHLAKKAKEGALIPSEFQGGSITISNLGMYNIKKFSAIVNPPQSAILSIGAGVAMPIVQDKNIVIATMMNITMSCDHRAIDGAIAAKFLGSLKEYIEMPSRLLI